MKRKFQGSVLAYLIALIIALIVGIVDFLPFFGSGIILAPWAVVALFLGEYAEALFLIGMCVALFLFRKLAEPKVVGNHTGLNPLISLISIYVGIPFCPTRCSYCSFISSDSRAFQKYSEAYLTALIKEIREAGPVLSGRRIRSFYMGGGTPTTLEPDQMKRLLSECEAAFHISGLKEVTVEAGRPDTITLEKLQVLKEAGVGRISINPQTMVQETLDRIGRKHTVQQVEEAFALARSLDHFIINMDLILGLEGEGMEEVETTMKAVSRLKPDNLTVHTLAVKRSSRMNEEGDGAKYLKENPLALAELMDRMIRLSADTARSLGLFPYYMYRQKNMAGNFENVGYARAGTEGIYNIEIMEERQSIAAFGAGGVSKVYTPAENRIERVPNVKGIEQYISRIDEMIQRKKEGFCQHDR